MEHLSSFCRVWSRFGCVLLMSAIGLWLQAQPHDVILRVQMPDPNMEAVVEVDGEMLAMVTGAWGAKEATVAVDGPFEYRFGTPAAALGVAWETVTGDCANGGLRNATATSDEAMAVVCFNACAPCEGCSDPFSMNYDPLAAAGSPASNCLGSGQGGCTYAGAVNFQASAQWDNGSCAFEMGTSDCPDHDGDGLVAVGDMLILLSSFGEACAVGSATDTNPLEVLIQQQIDGLSWSEKIAQIHRNTFWTTPDNSNPPIPGFTMSDGPHGVRFSDATSFPVGIGIAASWNRELAHDVGFAMGTEFHAYSKHQQLGPAVDLCRDPRNGRSPETGGEDPFLTAHMNVEVVRGIQKQPVIATIKHFNGVNQQVDRHNVNHVMTQRQLMEHYGYNFRRVMQDAGALSVMNAYNKVNGDKCAESADLLNGILKSRWGFPFYVVSDWGSVWDASKALKSGCDLEMDVDVSSFEEQLTSDYVNGFIDDQDLDRAVRRVLRVKYLTGMMDNFPQGNPITGANTPEHQALCLDAGREAIVLLKNEENILPLNTGQTVAMVGPSAAVAQLDGFGSSWVDPPYSITPLQGVLNKIPSGQIEFAPGCDIHSTDTTGFALARAAAEASDVVVFVGGLDPTQEGENYAPGPVDRTGGSVELPGMQQLLIQELAEVNPNVIVVLKSGGICSVPDAIDDMKGFLYAFYPGMEGGNAIADVLFGDFNPSGKLPVTMPVDDAQMPDWNADFSDDYNTGYRYYDELDITPQFPFGFGLSYTEFVIDNLQLDAASVAQGTPITATVDVTNVGGMAGAEVVQLYLDNQAAPVWMPEKELKGFEKVFLQPGEMATVSFTLGANELFYFDEALDRYEVAVGDYMLYAGGGSDALVTSVGFSVTSGQPAPDFEVTRVFSVPRYPVEGDSLILCAMVKNPGTQTVLMDEAVEVAFSIAGAEVAATELLLDTLNIGGATMLCASTGTYTVEGEEDLEVLATVDGNNVWNELIEDNNTLVHNIDVVSATEIVPNLCYLKPVTATSQESGALGASQAVDGDYATRWSSEFSDPQVITVDLLDVYNLNEIALAWETAYSSEFKINVSLDGAQYTTLVHETNADGGYDLYYPDVDARYIQVECLQRATQWGHSLWEIQAFGQLVVGMPEQPTPEVQLLPNPAQDEVRFEGLPGEVQMQLFTMTGQRLWAGGVRNGDPVALPRLRMPSGMYVVRLEAGEFRSSLNLVVD